MVDIQPTNQQSMSDDQELAKVLAGVNSQVSDAAAAYDPVVTTSAPEPVNEEDIIKEGLTAPKITIPDSFAPVSLAPAGELDSIKKDALVELRPLVDKLELEPEEKFDTYLLLLRSTDDKALVAPAHEAAKSIVDESRRAQALLDVIKEIDFLSGQPLV